jgi:hypothetical protein
LCVFSQHVVLPLLKIFTLCIDSILTSKQKVPNLNEHIIYWNFESNQRWCEVCFYYHNESDKLNRWRCTDCQSMK